MSARFSEVGGKPIASAMFGGNILSTGDRVGPGTFDDKAKLLSITGLRYPGGSLTEDFFDIRNPDATKAVSAAGRTTELMPLSTFMDYATDQGFPVTLVIPTRYALTDGAYGTRTVSDAYLSDLYDFISDVLIGKYGFGEIAAFEIGNEYWGSGQMSSREYGVVASAFASTIQRAIDDHKKMLLNSDAYQEPLIAVQIGQRGQSEALDGNQLNEIVMSQFDVDEAKAVDAVVAHYYTTEEPFDFLKSENRFNRMKEWEENPAFGDLKLLVTEWNVASPNSTQLGVRQPASLVAMFSAMVSQGVDAAYVWPIQQNTKNDLGDREGTDGLTLGGEAFRLMSEVLVDATYGGMQVTADNGRYFFRKGPDLIVFLTSQTDTYQKVNVDLTQWIEQDSIADVKTLTAETSSSGKNPNPLLISNKQLIEDGLLRIELPPNSVIRLIIDGDESSSAGSSRIVGTPRPDNLVGTANSEIIFGLGGNDVVNANDGNDTVLGGTGADRVLLGGGDDVYGRELYAFDLEGDRILGQGGSDIILGSDGSDTIDGGTGSDIILGAVGDDVLIGGWGADVIHGGAGEDTLNGGFDPDTLIGGLGIDVFVLTLFGDKDVFLDFEESDLIDLRSLGGRPTDFSEVLADAEFTEAGTMILEIPGSFTSVEFVGYSAMPAGFEGRFLF